MFYPGYILSVFVNFTALVIPFTLNITKVHELRIKNTEANKRSLDLHQRWFRTVPLRKDVSIWSPICLGW